MWYAIIKLGRYKSIGGTTVYEGFSLYTAYVESDPRASSDCALPSDTTVNTSANSWYWGI